MPDPLGPAGPCAHGRPTPCPTCTPLPQGPPQTSPCQLGTAAPPSSPASLPPWEGPWHAMPGGSDRRCWKHGGWGLCPGVWPPRTPQRAGHTTGSVHGGPACRCMGTPAAQDHMSRGGQEPRGLAFTAGALAVVVLSLQRSFGPNPCRFCSSWLSEPRGAD